MKWVGPAVAAAVLVASIIFMAYLWTQSSAYPPPGSDLPDVVTTTPQFATTPPEGVHNG